MRHGENTTYSVITPRRPALRTAHQPSRVPDSRRDPLRARLDGEPACEWRPDSGRDRGKRRRSDPDRDGPRCPLAHRGPVRVDRRRPAERRRRGRAMGPTRRADGTHPRVHARVAAVGWFTRPAWDAEALVGDDPRWGPPDPEGVFATDDRAVLEACSIGGPRSARCDRHRPRPLRPDPRDLGFENVLVSDDGEVVIIDFDDSGDSWYLHELAVALYPHESARGFGDRRDALVGGYRERRASCPTSSSPSCRRF